MSVDMILHNAKVYTREGFVEAGIAINEGRIVKIAKKTNLPHAANKIDLKGNLALPGLIDSHVHLRDQQLAYKEDFQSGTSAAAAGGITTVVDMPNNQPLTMSLGALKERVRLAESHIFVNVAFNSAFPRQENEIRRIVDAGAVGFKVYLSQQLGGVNVDDDEALLNAFKVTSQTQVPISIHAEDKSTIETTKQDLMKQGRKDLDAFLQAHSPEAEKKSIHRAARLAKNSGAQIHICHVSSSIGLVTVLEAKRTGCNITCEVTPHHLFLTAQHLKKYGSVGLELPPLRRQRDSTHLWQALEKGFIDTIGSDHAPHALEEKQTKSIWDVKPGIVGLETLLPLFLTEVNKGRLKIEQFIRLACEKPAEIFHLKGRGSLINDYFADVTVVDRKREHKIDASKFYSKAKFSPFDGWKAKGKAVKTFVNGRLIMDDGEMVANPGTGQIIK